LTPTGPPQTAQSLQAVFELFLLRLATAPVIPINGMRTLLEPARSMYERVAALENDTVVSPSFAPGFPTADFPECGPVIWGYGSDEAAVRTAVDQLYDKMISDESAWEIPILSPDSAVAEAIRLSKGASKPVASDDALFTADVGTPTLWAARYLTMNGKHALKAALAHQGPALVDVVTSRHELAMPPRIELAHARGFSLYMLRAILSGRGDELVELARTNLR
jgi:hypothetical protein